MATSTTDGSSTRDKQQVWFFNLRIHLCGDYFQEVAYLFLGWSNIYKSGSVVQILLDDEQQSTAANTTS